MSNESGAEVLDLQQAIREVRIAQAERDDVIVELRESERIRLVLLAEALAGVFDDLPDEIDEFALAILPGNPPRFWVDATSFVMMGRDKRAYRFVKDTRLGRTVLAEDTGVDVIADAVTRYVAERIVLRERALEAGWIEGDGGPRSAAGGHSAEQFRPARGTLWALAGFGMGMICGAFLLLVYAWISTGG
jgi:hypothetical protein